MAVHTGRQIITFTANDKEIAVVVLTVELSMIC
jgi:hypothetical protein